MSAIQYLHSFIIILYYLIPLMENMASVDTLHNYIAERVAFSHDFVVNQNSILILYISSVLRQSSQLYLKI